LRQTASASSVVLWLALALPAVLLVARYAADILTYGEALQRSGMWSVWLLVLTLLATPIRHAFPAFRPGTWLVKARRDIGVACFAYALLHTLIYLERKADLALILREAAQPGLWTGWIAFAVFLPLAFTSNAASTRQMGTRWKSLHRLVYAATALIGAHWVLTAFDPFEAWLYCGLFALLLAARFIPRRKLSSHRA